MPKNRKPSDQQRSIKQRTLLVSFSAAGWAFRSDGLAAKSLEFRQSKGAIKDLFDGFFFNLTCSTMAEARHRMADHFTVPLPVTAHASNGRGQIENLGLAPDISAQSSDASSLALTLLSETAPIRRAIPIPLCHAHPITPYAQPAP